MAKRTYLKRAALGLLSATVVSTSMLPAYAAPLNTDGEGTDSSYVAADATRSGSENNTNKKATVVANINTSFLGELDFDSILLSAVETEANSPFAKKGIAVVDEGLRIRKEPSEESEIVGKLYKDAGCDILGVEGDWAQIVSGSCEGYVKTEYILTGTEAEAYANENGVAPTVATVNADSLNIRAEASADSEIIGSVSTSEELTVLETTEDGLWVKVSVGGLEGYVSADYVDVGMKMKTAISVEEEQAAIAAAEAARKAAEEAARKAAEEAAKAEESQAPETTETQAPETTETETPETQAPETGETEAPETQAPETQAPETEAPVVNITDANETVWAVSNVNVRSGSSTSASKLGMLSSGASVTRTGICDNGWSRINYNGQEAYVNSSYLTTTEPPKVDNSASNNEGSSSNNTGSVGTNIVATAMKYVGYPYVYGGNSLTGGIDCSGFTQQIYAMYGISLPRTSRAQSTVGTTVSLSNLQPGDLLFYTYGGVVGHVAIYAGNNQVVHASSPSTGIIVSPMSYMSPAWAKRVIN